VAADGVDACGKEVARNTLADDGYLVRGGGILRAEGATGEKRDLHRAKKIVADDVVFDEDVVVVGGAGNVDVFAPRTLREEEGSEAGGLYAGDRCDLLLDLLEHGDQAWVFAFVAGDGGVDVEAKHTLAVEAGIDLRKVDETAQEHHGGDRENQRDSDLGDDEGLAERAAGSGVGGDAPVLEGLGDLDARGPERGEDAEENRGADGGGKSKEKQAKIERDVEPYEIRVGPARDHTQQKTVGDDGDDDAEEASGKGKQQAFGKKLTDEAQALSAEGLANGKLARSGRGAGEQKVRDVCTGDQQHQRGNAHQDLEWVGEPVAQGGEAGLQ